MKSHELMIGNYIQPKNSQFKIRVTSITKTQIIAGNNAVYDLKDIKPIIINPNLLRWCGFKQLQQLPAPKDSIRYSISIMASANRELVVYKNTSNSAFSLVGIQEPGQEIILSAHVLFLHQLQNLYFIIQNEQLDIVPGRNDYF